MQEAAKKKRLVQITVTPAQLVHLALSGAMGLEYVRTGQVNPRAVHTLKWLDNLYGPTVLGGHQAASEMIAELVKEFGRTGDFPNA